MDSKHKAALRANLDLAISTRSLIDIMKMHQADAPIIPQYESNYQYALTQVVDILAGDL